jgi:hypothetical protein
LGIVTRSHWASQVFIVFAVTAVGVLTLSYLPFKDVTLEEARSEVVSVEDGRLSALVTLNDGAHKPTISYDGNTALEYSDWASEVETRGDARSLWDMRFRVDVSAATAEIAHTRSIPEFEISQLTKLEDDHAIISYYVSPSGGSQLGPLTLTIAHYRWYFEDVVVTEDGALLTAQGPPERMLFKQVTPGSIEVHSDEIGPHSFTTEYAVAAVPLGELTLVAQEEIWFENPDES